MKYRKTMWAEMAPDVYGGKSCDRIVPEWLCAAEGDKDGPEKQSTIALNPRTFPPGTKVEIYEPLCPQCGEFRYPVFSPPKRGPLFEPKCGCGFDWDEWTREQYS